MSYEDGRRSYELAVQKESEGKIEEAIHGYLFAMFEGYEKAYANLATHLLKGTTGFNNPALAHKFLRLGIDAKHRDPEAILKLAGLYENRREIRPALIQYSNYLPYCPPDQIEEIQMRIESLTKKVEDEKEMWRWHPDIEELSEAEIEAAREERELLKKERVEKERVEKERQDRQFAAASSSASLGEALYESAIDLQKQEKHYEALDAYVKASFMGFEKAYASIGLYLLTGTGGIPVNKMLAREYIEMGVRSEHPRAMIILAQMYEKGDGVIQNDREALKLYTTCSRLDPTNVGVKASIIRVQDKISEREKERERKISRPSYNPELIHARVHGLDAGSSSRVPNTAELNAVADAVKTLGIDPQELETEISEGTTSTSGLHLRISVFLSLLTELKALKQALEEMGINSDLKSKGREIFLVVQSLAPLRRNFSEELGEKYRAALEERQQQNRGPGGPVGGR